MAVDTVEHRHAFRYGPADLTVDLPVRRCTSCGFEFLDEESEKIKLEAICEHLGILSPAGIRRIRERYGMTQAEFAEATGLGVATLVRWENGSMNHTRAYDRYVRLLADPWVMTRLRRLAQPSRSLTEDAGAGGKPWMALEVTPNLRAQQSAFSLRSVA